MRWRPASLPTVPPRLAGSRPFRVLTSSVVLGLIAAIGSWNVVLLGPSSGLDPSWQAALYLAVHDGLHFGTQVVWTYGPLGFLSLPGVWFSGLAAIAFVYSALLYVALCVSVVYLLRRALGALPAFVLTLLVLAAAPGIEVPVALAGVWCLAALADDPPPFAAQLVVIGGGVLGASEILALPRSGLAILAMCAITPLGLPGRLRRLATFAGCWLLSVIVLWFVAGQGVGNVGPFVRNALQVVSGYSEAMGTTSASSLYVPGVIAVAVALTAGAWLASGPSSRRWAAAAAIGLASFDLYKESVVRQDTGHVEILLSTAIAVVLAMPRRGRWVVSGLAVAGAVVIALAAPRPLHEPLDVNPLDHLRTARTEVDQVLHPSKTEFVGAVALALQYRLAPSTLKLLHGHTVDVLPWEESLVWAYDLHWDPLPIFQDYSAYTAALDRVNADKLRSASAPQRILRENAALVDPSYATGSIDGRNPTWDPPGQALALLCNYVALQSTPRWQVLGKGRDRCGAPRLLRTDQAGNGTPIRIPDPRPGTIVYAELGRAGVSGLERLRTLVYRADFRYLTVNAGAVYRLVPGTAGDGLLMSAAPGADFPAPFGLSPRAHTISLDGMPGTVTVRLFEMRVGR